MAPKHIALFLEQAYGHIIPTLGFAAELIRRGHRVSYAVISEFAPAIARTGAHAVVFAPMIETRRRIYEHTARPKGRHHFDSEDTTLSKLMLELRTQRTSDSLQQLTRLYEQDKPDLVLHDDCLDIAGRELANRWGITKIQHSPEMLTSMPQLEQSDKLMLVSVPKFFNGNAELFDARIVFIGFSPEGRREFFEPWQRRAGNQKSIVACPSTGLHPPVEFCRLIVEAFRHSRWNVILSISLDLDPVSAMGEEALANLPDNIRLNRHSSNLDVLEHACLFIGQGGQGSTLEAIYAGVPSLLLPGASFQDIVAHRVVELGLGTQLPLSTATPESLRSLAEAIIADADTLTRVKRAQEAMRAENSATRGADIIEHELQRS